MQNMGWKIILIIVIVGGSFWALMPPSEKIRLGKDLRGGVSLVYSVDLPEDSSAQESQQVLDQTINVLKKRINPNGVFDISMQPQGNSRIEIVMPLPTDEVKNLGDNYRAALEDFMERAGVDPLAIDEALRQGTLVKQFGGNPGTKRGKLIRNLQQAYKDRAEALKSLEQMQADGATDATALRRTQAQAAAAEVTYEDLYDQLLSQNLDRARVTRALQLSKKKRDTGQTDDAGQPILTPSPRETELQAISQEYPHLNADPLAEDGSEPISQGGQSLSDLVSAFDTYESNRVSFDDPEDLMRLLQGAGVLQFHIAVEPNRPEGVNIQKMREQLMERGPENTESRVAAWFPIEDLKQWYDTPSELQSLLANPQAYFASRGRDLVAAERNGQFYLLLYTTDQESMTHKGDIPWTIVSAGPAQDSLGRPAVSFRLDQSGAGLMGRLTGAHVQEPMAIVLDGAVYSAPNINSQITQSGIIQGSFSQSELNYLSRVLAAGSLEAALSDRPISINILGPSLGADNLTRGAWAFIVALIAVGIFMVLYYFFCGFVADAALLSNGIIIFGVMSMIDATFTLPGLAGIVLTIGMAVDANVLIYERIREELRENENDLRAAIREGYRKAFSTIVDGNVTNLIVCLVLWKTATAEVQGFATTLSIGICATLFTALFVTRVIFTLYAQVLGIRKLRMLPMVVPALARALHPKVNWVGLRGIFWTARLCLGIVSVVLILNRGAELFDTEFRGGVTLTMRTRLATLDGDASSDRLLLLHVGPESVQRRIQSLGDTDPSSQDQPIAEAKAALALAQDQASKAAEGAAKTEADEAVQRAQVRLEAAEAEKRRQIILQQMRNAKVLTVGETTSGAKGVEADSFQVKVANPPQISEEKDITEAIKGALVKEFASELEISPKLSFRGDSVDADQAVREFTFRISDRTLGKNIDRPDVTDRIRGELGGVAILVQDISPPVELDDLKERLDRMRRQPEFSKSASGRLVEVFGLDPVENGKGYEAVAVTVYDPQMNYETTNAEIVDTKLAVTEWQLVSEALKSETSFEQVSSFSSAIARTLKANAVVAVVLSLLGILCYIWIRFGSLRYSLAAIVALVHDVLITVGAVALTGYIGAQTVATGGLQIEAVQIDLGVVAALLTVIGYSLNDTIVILDRIRENRGKLPLPTLAIVNSSINQTVSRTVLTSFTTLLAVLIIFVAGGTGIRPFAFCLLVGILVGTYSSVAIASPLVFTRKFSTKSPSDAELHEDGYEQSPPSALSSAGA